MFPICSFRAKRVKRILTEGLPEQRRLSIPLPDESQDAVTSIFMFHEVPPKVRRSFSVNSRAC
jgi:hypothetical protein